MPNSGAQVYAGDRCLATYLEAEPWDWILPDMKKYVEDDRGDWFLDRGSQLTISLLGRGAAKEKKEAFDPTGEKRARIVTAMRQEFPGLHFAIGGTTSIDIHFRPWNKGIAILHYLEQFEDGRVMFVGDGFGRFGNDEPVRRVADLVIEVDSPAHLVAIWGAGSVAESDQRVADLQRLCERAVMELENHWDRLLDDCGYGPVNLLRDLEKAANGAEYRELRVANEFLRKALAEAV